MHRRKEREVAARSDRMTVSLVGYTNAGKSTLLNTLTGADVLAEDKLFATLDTRTRRWQLPGWGPVLLSDTVGFIRDLPHSLIASFKATLEEARQADLLLHVADASNPAALDQIAAVYKVLEELGISEKDTLLVLNKIDAIRRARHARSAERALSVGDSGQRPDRRRAVALAAAVSDALTHHFLDVDIETDVANGRLLALPGEERRNPQPHVHRRPRFDPLPHAAQVSGPDPAGRSAHPAAQQRLGLGPRRRRASERRRAHQRPRCARTAHRD